MQICLVISPGSITPYASDMGTSIQIGSLDRMPPFPIHVLLGATVPSSSLLRPTSLKRRLAMRLVLRDVMAGSASMHAKKDWAAMVRQVREQVQLNQTSFGQRLHSSAMAVSRWERGVQEPPAGVYIQLGNLAGDPHCWYFWGRAGLHSEDVRRVMPQLQRRLRTISVSASHTARVS
jgi:hypothetical protein